MNIAIRAPADTGTGGDFYNRRMVAALRAAGRDAAVIAPDSEAPRGWIVIHDARASLASAAANLLVHHPSQATREALAGCARVIASGEGAAAHLASEFAVPPEVLRVVPPGASQRARSSGSPDGGCRILSVGALAPRKGCDVLLRALGRLPDLDWTLTFAGRAREEAYADSLASLAHTQVITKRVTFAGAVGDDALERLWLEADVFALASSWESHGTAVADALGRGVPVAVTAASAAGVNVPADAGALCEDEAGLSKALRRLIFDRALRAELSDGAWRAGQALPGWDERARAFAGALTTG